MLVEVKFSGVNGGGRSTLFILDLGPQGSRWRVLGKSECKRWESWQKNCRRQLLVVSLQLSVVSKKKPQCVQHTEKKFLVRGVGKRVFQKRSYRKVSPRPEINSKGKDNGAN